MELIRLEGFHKVLMVDCFQKEFTEAVSEKWEIPYKRFLKKLFSDLNVLEIYGPKAIQLQSFEQLEDTKYNIYSIRHPETKKNVRVLYVIESGVIVLLTAFLEKNASDYSKAVKRAEKRYKDTVLS